MGRGKNQQSKKAIELVLRQVMVMFHLENIKLKCRSSKTAELMSTNYETDNPEKTVEFSWNHDLMKTMPFYIVVFTMLHEIGHYKTKVWNIKSEVEQEYQAERFALNMLKKHFPELVQQCVDYMKEELNTKPAWWKKHCPSHYKAFRKIKEYRTRTK
jgi:hypothetical protein